jgi:hypothetical protein
MSKGFFTDKISKPSNNDVVNIIGKAKNNWDIILRYITSDLNLKGNFKFYGINYGWALRFNKSGKSIVSLYPDKDCFTVQIILNKDQVDSALTEDLDTSIIKTIMDKEAIHEGKWIYLKVDKATEMNDIFELINIRIKIK